MNRRQLLSIVALSTPLSGCIEGDSGGSTETPSPEGVEPGCSPSMCGGTKIAEVVVVHGFSGDARLHAQCRDEEFSIQSGESVQIAREEDAESCGISLSIDGERAFSEHIAGHERVTLTVGSNGEVEDDWVIT